MEIGLIFALLAAVCFAGGSTSTRRAVFHAGESFTGVIITISVGVLFFFFLTLLTGDWTKLWSLSWQGFVLLGTAGIIHFIFGRLLSFTCWRLIGANKGGAIGKTQIFYSVVLGIILFKEPLTTFLVLGVLFIAAGATLVSVEKGDKVTKLRGKGILAGFGGAACWGISPALIKPAVAEIGSPYAAAFVSFLAAFLVVVGLLFSSGQRQQLMQLHRRSVIPILLGGASMTIGQLMWYTALGYSPVSIATPLLSTSALFTFFFSFLINRNIEVFTWKVFIGIVATVAGSFLLFQ